MKSKTAYLSIDTDDDGICDNPHNNSYSA